MTAAVCDDKVSASPRSPKIKRRKQKNKKASSLMGGLRLVEGGMKGRGREKLLLGRQGVVVAFAALALAAENKGCGQEEERRGY